jgi:azurin
MLCSVSLSAQTAIKLSDGAATFASSQFQSAAFAVDGDPETRWESNHAVDPAFLTIDLGQAYNLSQVVIDWEAANAANYTIQGSNNNSSWTTLATRTGGSFGDRTDTVAISGIYRYVRMSGTTRSVGNDWGYSIWESAAGAPLLHDVGYYTLNRIPAGERLAVPLATAAGSGVPVAKEADAPRAAPRVAAPRPSAAAPDARVDASISVAAEPGLKFSATRLEARAGSRVRLVLENPADMPHNLVVVAPGRADAVHEASMRMGLDGPALQFVPRTRDVLFHTRLVDPGKSDTLVFTAPRAAGEYPYLCTFPGHGIVMRGVLRVVP